MKKKENKWRNSKQIAGVRSQLKAALNHCTNGAEVMVDIKTVRNLLEICDQAMHTEMGHEMPESWPDEEKEREERYRELKGAMLQFQERCQPLKENWGQPARDLLTRFGATNLRSLESENHDKFLSELKKLPNDESTEA